MNSLVYVITTTSNNSHIPVGSICQLSLNNSSVPGILLLCDGREITKDMYPSLFEALNTEPEYLEVDTVPRKIIRKLGIDIPNKKIKNPNYSREINIPDLRDKFIMAPEDQYPTIIEE